MRITITFWMILLVLTVSPESLGQSLLHVTGISSGGGSASSTSYGIKYTIGQPLVDISNATSFTFEQGFWYEHQAIDEIYNSAYLVNNGWNMVSVAKEVPDYSKKHSIPECSV